MKPVNFRQKMNKINVIQSNPVVPSRNISKINKIKEKTFELLSTSTLHGLSRLTKAKINKKKFFIFMWFTFILTSFSAGSFFVIDNIIDYLKFNTVTTIDLINERESQFPTVSICGYPRINLSLEKTILNVRFDRIDIKNFSQIFEEYYDSVYGKCFRFNSGKNIYNQSIPILSSSTSGKPNDLKINLYADIPNKYDFSELLIYIHNHSSPPFDIDNGGKSIFIIILCTYSSRVIYF